jgi:septum formation inhibitor-activating ATPase MinD
VAVTNGFEGRPGIIVVAEQQVYDLLRDSGVGWDVQQRADSVAHMWESLRGGRLSQQSRALVFSDSLHEGLSDGTAEMLETAKAVAVMAGAGAKVFIALWKPAEQARIAAAIAQEASRLGQDPSNVAYTFLPVEQGGRAVLETMRVHLDAVFAWPGQYPANVDVPLSRTPMQVAEWNPQAAPTTPPPMPAGPVAPPAAAPVAPPAAAPVAPPAAAPVAPPAAAPVAPPAAPAMPPAVAAPVMPPVAAPVAQPAAPAMPPVTAAPAVPGAPAMPTIGATVEAPAPGVNEALTRPPLPGQVTITVTSSKGGSGKSTTAMLLASTIAQASAKAGRPLRVCLVDMDTRDGQVASLIGEYMPTALNIRVQPVWDEDTILRHLVRDERLGIDCLLAPIRPRSADNVGPDFYRVVINTLKRTHDVVIMDTSVQYLDPLISQVCLPEASAILFVTTLATTAVQGMARALREITTSVEESGMGIPREKIGIVVNQSVANVGMEKDQVLAAGLGIPVVGVIPLATKDVLAATNLNKMEALTEHPLLGPAYFRLAQRCLPNAALAPLMDQAAAPAQQAPAAQPQPVQQPVMPQGQPGMPPAGYQQQPAVAQAEQPAAGEQGKRRGFLRRG